jgi:NAD+ kinase
VNRLGFIVKPNKPEAGQLLDDLVPWLDSQGVVPVTLDEERVSTPAARIVPESEFATNIDMCVVLGGDGTMLRASALVADAGIPILGINLGRLGFLTAFDPGQARDAITRAIAGDLRRGERMRLSITYTPVEGEPVSRTALNDAVVHQGAMARLVELNARLEGDFIASYRADGLIAATPTGSTAYNLAAGGPIIEPQHEAMVLTPICAHSLTNRPLVVAGNRTISITLGSADARGVVLTVDGQWARTFQPGDQVDITSSARPLVTFESGKAFFDILREKLHWGARSDQKDG